MEKVKIAVLDGPEDILGYFGDNIQPTTNLNEANLIILAGNEEVSPEYYNEVTKDESMHNPVKDYKLIESIKQIHASNPRSTIVGLRGGAGFVDAINGSRIQQKIISDDYDTIDVTAHHDSDGSIIPHNSHFQIPSYRHYYTTCPGNNRYNYLETTINRISYSIATRYSYSSLRNKMISIHVDPFMLDPNSKEWILLRGLIRMQPYPYINPADVCFRTYSDTSIWSSRSKVNSDMNYAMDSRACFGSMVKGPLARAAQGNNKAKVDWVVKVMKPKGWSTQNDRCVTFFVPEEYDAYYKRLQQVYPFDYEIDDSNADYTLIKLSIDAPCMWHKMILTQMRYIYQWPMHFILKDALTLKGMKEFKDLDILDIMQVVAKTISSQVCEPSEYMIHPYTPTYKHDFISKPMDDEEFRKLCKKHGDTNTHPSLNSIGEEYTTKFKGDFKYISKEFPCFTTWNVFMATFDIRLPYYKANIETFKQLLK